jgi:hypothetical protein
MSRELYYADMMETFRIRRERVVCCERLERDSFKRMFHLLLFSAGAAPMKVLWTRGESLVKEVDFDELKDDRFGYSRY